MVGHAEKVHGVCLFIIEGEKLVDIILRHIFKLDVWDILFDDFEIIFELWNKLSDPFSAWYDCFSTVEMLTFLCGYLYISFCLFYLQNLGVL